MAASDTSTKEAAFLHAFQCAYFDDARTRGTPSQQADVVRTLISQIQAARVSGLISDDAAVSLDKQYETDYAGIVDNFDSKSGTNNFAEGALALCSLNRNESQSWQSSLTMDSAKNLPGVNRLLETAKASSRRHQLADKMNDVISLKIPAPKQSNSSMLTSGATATNFPAQSHSDIHVDRHNGQASLFSNADQQNPNMNRLINAKSNQNASGLYLSAFAKHPSMVPDGASWSSSGHHRGANGQGYSTTVHQSAVSMPAQRKPLFTTNNRAPFTVGCGETMDPYQRKPEGIKCMKPDNEDQSESIAAGMFKTAREQMVLDNQRRHGGQNREQQSVTTSLYGNAKRSLGTRRGPANRFVPPVMNQENEDGGSNVWPQKAGPHTNARGPIGHGAGACSSEDVTDERLKGLEPKMIELIMNEIMDHGAPVSWDDVAGLEFAKKTIKEIIVWPMLRPDIFTGLRGPPKGMLLFGPPGTGKTLIGKCIASQSKSTFFSISASSLTSKWVGEGEKMVRALFGVSRCHQPAVVFIDEIDSLLTQRTDGEHEASRRIKTEFLVQLDGATTESDERILVIGATNRPQEIDEAARRRFVKRLYIPLPEQAARKQIIVNLLHQQTFQLTDENFTDISIKSHGYSGADMANLCREAALGPIRSVNFADIETISADEVRPILYEDFEEAFNLVRASVSTKDLDVYINWNNLYGSGGTC